MDANLSFVRSDNAFARHLTLDDVRQRAPAVFAESAHQRTSSKYTFIPTQKVLAGLMGAGLVPVEARQTHTRRASPTHARHIVRLRRRLETINLRDSVPEVVFLNSHDGSSGYHLRLGLYRVACTNGLIVSKGAFSAIAVAHRGDVVDEVVSGALKMAERFEALAVQVERMENRRLSMEEQQGFAERALALKYQQPGDSGMRPSQLLMVRREADAGDDLWTVLNRVQENLIKGGLSRWLPRGRLSRTRRITSIREDVRINSGLWDLAAQVLVA